MKLITKLAFSVALVVSANCHAFSPVYLIQDPGKTAQHTNDAATASTKSAEKTNQHWQEIAKDLEHFVDYFNLMNNDDSAAVSYKSMARSETSNLSQQSSMQPPVGLCDQVEYALAGAEFFDEGGCLAWEDDTQIYRTTEKDQIPLDEAVDELFINISKVLDHRNPETKTKDLHYEYGVLLTEHLGASQFDELSQEDSEAMDQLVDLLANPETFVIPKPEDIESIDDQIAFLENLTASVVEEMGVGIMKSSYVRRSRNEDNVSAQSDIYMRRNNQVKMAEGIYGDDIDPTIINQRFLNHETVEMEQRSETIGRALLLKQLFAVLESSLTKELAAAVKFDQILDALDSGWSSELHGQNQDEVLKILGDL